MRQLFIGTSYINKMSAAPQLRGLGMRAWSRVLYGALATSCCFAVWFKINVVEARKQHYKDFYENYDDEKVYNGMKRAGVFKGFEDAS